MAKKEKLNEVFQGLTDKRVGGSVSEALKIDYTDEDLKKKLTKDVKKILSGLEVRSGEKLECKIINKDFIEVTDAPTKQQDGVTQRLISLKLGKDGIDLSYRDKTVKDTELFKAKGGKLALGIYLMSAWYSKNRYSVDIFGKKRYEITDVYKHFLEYIEERLINTLIVDFLRITLDNSYSKKQFYSDVKEAFMNGMIISSGDKVVLDNPKDSFKEDDFSGYYKPDDPERYWSISIDTGKLKYKFKGEVYAYPKNTLTSVFSIGCYDTYTGLITPYYTPQRGRQVGNLAIHLSWVGDLAKNLFKNIQIFDKSFTKEKFFGDSLKYIEDNAKTYYGDSIKLIHKKGEFFIEDMKDKNNQFPEGSWVFGVDFSKLSYELNGTVYPFPTINHSTFVVGAFNPNTNSFGDPRTTTFKMFCETDIERSVLFVISSELSFKNAPRTLYVLRLGSKNTSLIDNNGANLEGEVEFLSNYFQSLDIDRGQYITLFKVTNLRGTYGNYVRLNNSSKDNPNRSHTPNPVGEMIGAERVDSYRGGLSGGKWFSFPKDGAWESEKLDVVEFAKIKDLAYELGSQKTGNAGNLKSYDFLGALRKTFPDYKEFD